MAVLYQAVVNSPSNPSPLWAVSAWPWTTFLRPIMGSGVFIDDLPVA